MFSTKPETIFHVLAKTTEQRFHPAPFPTYPNADQIAELLPS